MFGDQFGHLADEVYVLVDRAGHLLELGVVGHKVADVVDPLDFLFPLYVRLVLPEQLFDHLADLAKVLVTNHT